MGHRQHVCSGQKAALTSLWTGQEGRENEELRFVTCVVWQRVMAMSDLGETDLGHRIKGSGFAM